MARKKAKPLRAYQKIWHVVRDTKTCTVRTATDKVARLKKAVIKEKYMDSEYHATYNGKLAITVEKRGPHESDVTFTLDDVSKYL